MWAQTALSHASLVHSWLSSQVFSSVCPSQSLSLPSHSSWMSPSAVQTLRPVGASLLIGPQLRLPAHALKPATIVQGVESFSEIAVCEHAHDSGPL